MDIKNDILGNGQNKAMPSLQAPINPLQAYANNQPAEQKLPKSLSYTDIFLKLNPREVLTPEEEARERKRDRSRRIIAAVGDGISALSNLYFSTKGAPSSYTGQNTLSGAYGKRYDKIKAEREANKEKWYAGYMMATQADDAVNWRNKMQKYRVDRDTVSDQQYKDESTWRRNTDERNFKYNADRDIVSDNHRDRQLKETIRQNNISNTLANENLKQRAKAQAESARLEEERIKALNGKVNKGKIIGFSDGNGKDVGIHENVWKGSMPQVFDVLSKEVKPDGESEKSWEYKVKNMTSRDKEDFVKQNWTKSAGAVAMMQALSKIDPANMQGTADDDFGFTPVDNKDVDSLFD